MICAALEKAGLREEALTLGDSALWEESERLLLAGRVVTAASSRYPVQWLARLGDTAPPALWAWGLPPKAPLLAVVGSRSPSDGAKRFVRALVAAAGESGLGIVSGGARGCDRVAIQTAARMDLPHLEIIPCGLGTGFGYGRSMLTVSEPRASFTVASAMERNALVYAAAEAAVVVRPRFKQGGTWLGAVDALRRRYCRVLVWTAEDSLAVRALQGLGATSIRDVSELSEVLMAPYGQWELKMFGGSKSNAPPECRDPSFLAMPPR